jgi:trk system potassium uptake protein TrkH
MTDRGATSLMTAARPLVVLRYLSQLLLVLAVLAAVPLALSLVPGMGSGAAGAHGRLLVLVLALAALALPLSRLPAARQIQWNEALAVTALAFVLSPLLMTWPLTGYGLAPLDAWFEAVSGITTTGLSTLGPVADRPPLFLFTRAWMQWYGGLGIAVLSVALVMRHHPGSRRLLASAGDEAMDVTARTHARRIAVVYLLLTLGGIALLWAVAGSPGFAVLHALAAISTGGFSSRDQSLAGLGWETQAAVALVCLAGAVALPLYALARARGPGVLARDPELRALLAATLIAGLGLGLIGHLGRGADGLPWPASLGQGMALAVAAQSTTGFSPTEVAALDPASKWVLMASMLVGGSAGSTAGGFKLVRLLILLRLLQLALRRSAAPDRAVLGARVGGERIEPGTAVNALLLIALWMLVVGLSWLPFLAYGHDPLDALFEVISATGTVGLSAGLAGPDLEAPLKLVLGLDMLLGRVEIIAILVVLYPATWIGRRRGRGR